MSDIGNDLFLKVSELSHLMKESPHLINKERLKAGKAQFTFSEAEGESHHSKEYLRKKKELLSEVIFDIAEGCTQLRVHRWIIASNADQLTIEKQNLSEEVSGRAIYYIQLSKQLAPIPTAKSNSELEFTQEEINVMIYFMASQLSKCLF